MHNEIRKSGIAAIGNVSWGTHFCQFYQTKQDLIDILVPYFKTGLENNEFCMWVTADNLTVEEARKAISKAIKGFSKYFKNGQIEILSYTEWYLKGGSFKSQNVLDGWIEKLNQALKKGYAGLRLTGNTFWLENKDWRSFAEYEQAVNNVIGQYKIIALCTYCLDKCGATEIVDVTRNHELALIKQEGKWELFENSRYKATKENLQESEELFRVLSEASPLIISISRVSDGTVLYINKAYSESLGYKNEDIVGKSALNVFYDPSERQTLMDKLNEQGFLRNYEIRVKKADGTSFWALTSVRYVNFGGERALMSTTLDISDRKRTEKDIIQLNRELQAIRECDQTIVHSSDEMTLFSDICRILCTTVGYRLAWIGAVEHDEAKSVRPLAWNSDKDYLAGANITWADTARGRGPTGLAIRTGRTHFFQDFATEPLAGPWREEALSRGYRSSIAIPLKEADGSVFCVLCLYSSEPNSFNQAEVRLLEELVNDISFGVVALRERAKHRQTEIDLAHLASFPELNPNPILEIEENGRIKYLNPSAKVNFPDLTTLGVKHPFMAGCGTIIQTLKTNKIKPSITREIQIGELWYEQTVIYLPAFGSYRLYGRNTTERKKTEEALKDSEERFSKAFHDSPVALSISRISDGIFIDVNEAFIHLFGYNHEELIGQKATELNIYDNPVDRSEIVRLLQQHGKVVNYEVTARTKNGSEIKALTSAEKIEINGQEHIIWTTIDISEREQAEYLLRETSNYLNNLLDYANAPIIVWDPHFRISRFNPAFERLTGYKSNDVIGLGLDILFPENKKTESLQQIARTLSGERWEVVEISIRCIDGEERTVLWNSANVYDTNGKIIIATIAQGQDITERKQAEDALKISETQYRRLFEAAKDGILLLDADTGLILDVNPFLVEMLGLPYKEFIGKNLWELGYFRDIVASKANFSELQQNSYIRYENLPLRTVDGREMKVEFVSNLYKVDHRKIIQCNVRDITKRKQAEEEVKKLNEITKRHAAELEVANKELEAFAYSVSHDLRAPLRTMEGFSQALLEDCNDLLNDECKDYLKRIQNSAELMAQLIDDMLRLSRITRADMILDYVDLTEMAQVIAAKLKNNEPKRKVNFVINPGLTAYGDEKLLSIVLENLFENAIKFTGKMREANIDFGVTEREGQKVYFVHDNGVGFDMAYANKLFKPFQRLHSLGEFPGTGIGLASVQRIIQRHGGQVWAEGKVGEGAIFYFTLG
jgi:PAS domain S-box-containing protein